jgi:phenylpropionate dioxygenase-like ring-hydroxylating dioxygenase large terminal subunit
MTGTDSRHAPTQGSSDAATYHRSWFPVALSAELDGGALVGRDFLGTRVVAYRGPDGAPVVQGAWCPHLGADLSVGRMVDGRLRCAYHHWSFDAAGACVHIPTGDKIPPGARLANYPCAEAWGLIWAFNGETPLFDVPRVPGAEQADLVVEARLRGIRPIPPWVATSNGIDFQHLCTLHGLATAEPAALEVREHGIEYRVETPGYRQHGLITGVNTFSQHVRVGGGDLFMLFSGAPIAPDRTRSFYVIGVSSGGRESPVPRPTIEAQLRGLREFVTKLLDEDEPVLSTIRFRKGVLVASDRHLARFLKYVEEFPRGLPPGE